jgi:hypothetical protein
MNRTAVLTCLAVLGVSGSLSVQAGESPAALTDAGSPSRVITTSATGRFVVEGTDNLANSQYTRWAEDTATRLERLLGLTFPSGKRETAVEIILVSGATAGPSLSVRCVRESGLKRILTINEARQPDYELMQDGLCRLLLAGCMEDRRRASGLPAGGQDVPQWFSMGLAQNLFAENRVRNRRIVTKWVPETDRPALSAVLQWRILPEGWPRNRALCGMAVYWMGTLREGGGFYVAMLDRLAGDHPLTAGWVTAQIAPSGSAGSAERDWRDWLARQGQAIQEFGELSGVLLDQLRAELDLVVPAAPEAAVLGGGSRRLAPEEVVAERPRTALLRQAAAEKIQRLRRLTLGKAPEFVEIGEAYGRFYEAVSRNAWTPLIRYRLARAHSAFDRLAELTRAREAYLDEVERDEAGEDEWIRDAAMGSPQPVLEKSRIEAYLDDAEKRFQPSGKQ